MNPFKVILFFGISITVSSCFGQNTPERSSKTIETDTPGNIVSELDAKILLVFQDSDNNYWFGGNDQGAYRYDGQNLVLYTISDGLCSNNILGIQEDKFGILYFDTPNGISKFDGQKFTTLEVTNSATSVYDWKLTPDDLWFRMGIGGNGPYRYDGSSLYHLEFPYTDTEKAFYLNYPNSSYSPSGIYTIYQDKKGNIWFGTSSIGVIRYDGRSLRWLYEEQLQSTPGGGDFGFRSIIEDKDGYFWFNNTSYRYEILTDSLESDSIGPLNYKKEKGAFDLSDEKETDTPYFLSVVEDNQGDLWGVTYSDGVWQNNGKELIHHPVKTGDTTVLLFSIYKDNNGELWLGTHSQGVFKYNGTTFEKFKPID